MRANPMFWCSSNEDICLYFRALAVCPLRTFLLNMTFILYRYIVNISFVRPKHTFHNSEGDLIWLVDRNAAPEHRDVA